MKSGMVGGTTGLLKLRGKVRAGGPSAKPMEAQLALD